MRDRTLAARALVCCALFISIFIVALSSVEHDRRALAYFASTGRIK